MRNKRALQILLTSAALTLLSLASCRKLAVSPDRVGPLIELSQPNTVVNCSTGPSVVGSWATDNAVEPFVAVNPAYTSQDCSQRGHRQVLPLSDRRYTCPCCGVTLDRDLNASLNILGVGLHTLGLASRSSRIYAGE